MEKKYSVEEILDAINDLNNFEKKSKTKKPIVQLIIRMMIYLQIL